MKKFRFRLERVLQYKEALKNERMKELLEKNMLVREKNEHLRELESAMLLNTLEQNAMLAAEQLYLAQAYGSRLKSEIELTKEELAEAEKHAQEAMKKYVEASKEEKSLQVLKDKKREEYEEEIQREETNFLDELAVQRNSEEKW